MNGNTGPRDWAPYKPPAPASYRLPVPDYAAPLGRPRTRVPGALSAVLGIVALAMTVAIYVTGSTGRAYVVSTLGITAVALGLRALSGPRGRGWRMNRVLTWTGIAAGSVGTLLMVVQLIAFYSGNPIAAMPLPFAYNAPAAGQAIPTTIADQSLPAATDGDDQDARLSMAQALGTIAFVLDSTRVTGGQWPEALGTTSAGAVFVQAPLDDGRTIAVLPADTELAYWTSDDRLTYGMRLSSTVDPSLAAAYDSTRGTVITQ